VGENRSGLSELSDRDQRRALSPRVSRMRCSALSAFTRVFDALWRSGAVHR
jgi:hypothetical protein